MLPRCDATSTAPLLRAILGAHSSHSSLAESNRAKVCPGLAGSPICALFGVAKAMPPSISASIDSVRSDRPLNRLASTPKPLAFQKRLPVRTSGT